jgi:hypothetical protein
MFQKKMRKEASNLSPETPKEPIGSGLTKKAKAPQEVSMKDFQDLMGQKFESNAMAAFEQIQAQMKYAPAENEEDFEDELQDQMAESLF